ncbi:MAG: hypothetical protein QXO21_05435 [Candidatus Anstonellales archaeon]
MKLNKLNNFSQIKIGKQFTLVGRKSDDNYYVYNIYPSIIKDKLNYVRDLYEKQKSVNGLYLVDNIYNNSLVDLGKTDIVEADYLQLTFVSNVEKNVVIQIYIHYVVNYEGGGYKNLDIDTYDLKYKFNVGDEVSVLDLIGNMNLRSGESLPPLRYTLYIIIQATFIVYAKVVIASDKGRTYVGYICKKIDDTLIDNITYENYNLKFTLKDKDKDHVLVELENENFSFEKLFNNALKKAPSMAWQFNSFSKYIIKNEF